MNNTHSAPYQGSCLCGAVKYQVDVIEPHIGHCHCTMCRKFHGAAFATLGEAKKEHFRWLQGEDVLSTYVAKNATARTFCSICGSSLTFKATNGADEAVEFSLGTLDNAISERPEEHIYVDFKANWLEWQDELPKYHQDTDGALAT